MIRDVMVFNTPHQPLRPAASQNKNPELSEILDLTEAYETTQKASHIMKHMSRRRGKFYK